MKFLKIKTKMETRKIIKFGNSSFVITLPPKWLKANNLNQENTLEIFNMAGDLLIKPKKIPKIKRAVITIDGKLSKLFKKQLISYYIQNFEIIEIHGKNLLSKLDEIKIIKEKLSSIEIFEIKEDRILLKDITSFKELDKCKLIEEIIEMEKTIFDEILKDSNPFIISNIDININKLTFLTFKLLNNNLTKFIQPEEIKNSVYYWRIVSALENIGDILKRISRNKKQMNLEERSIVGKLILDTKSYYQFITDLFLSKIDIKKNLNMYLDKKQSLLREIEENKMNIKENIAIYYVLGQLLKDLLGKIEEIILCVIDINSK